ncbi:hypothetical protein ACRALDRAFT_1067798 [Sodiomyces alcalophilus JCM 7366]|uniref:uncharacterized protein n=1 Tax=Sodiomyces alcalophilus JCM 7366 TaxID=591952 RepID=UPI0039B682D1
MEDGNRGSQNFQRVAPNSIAAASARDPKGQSDTRGRGECPNNPPRPATPPSPSSSYASTEFRTPPQYPAQIAGAAKDAEEEKLWVTAPTSPASTDLEASRGEEQHQHGLGPQNIDQSFGLRAFLEHEMEKMKLCFGAVDANQSPARPADLIDVQGLLEFGRARDKKNLQRRMANIEWQKSMKTRLGDDWEPVILCTELTDEVDEDEIRNQTAEVVPRLMDGRTFKDGRSPIFAMDNCFNQVYTREDDVPVESCVGWPFSKEYVIERASGLDQGEGGGASRKFPVPLENRLCNDLSEPYVSSANKQRTSVECKRGRPVFDRLALAPLDEQGRGPPADEDEDQQTYDFLLETLHPKLEDLIKYIESVETE